MTRIPVIAAAILSAALLAGCSNKLSDADRAQVEQTQRDSNAAKASAASARQSADAARTSEVAARQSVGQPAPVQAAQSSQFRDAQRK